MKWLKIILITIVVLIALLALGFYILQDKAKNGWARYETEQPTLTITDDRPAVLHFTKTTAWRHSAAIDASKEAMIQLCQEQDWQLYQTEEGGVFNIEQLGLFDVVIWDNSTGPVLNEAQQKVFENYINTGGGYLGIHGAGDFSHNKWPWYTENLIGAEFSHHPIQNHVQKATVFLSASADSTWTTPPVWLHSDEWYVFHETPANRGAKIIYHIDGTKIDPNGDLFFLVTGFDYGMGQVHPVAWTKEVNEGRAYYTSMGHTAETFANENFIGILTKAITWAGRIEE